MEVPCYPKAATIRKIVELLQADMPDTAFSFDIGGPYGQSSVTVKADGSWSGIDRHDFVEESRDEIEF